VHRNSCYQPKDDEEKEEKRLTNLPNLFIRTDQPTLPPPPPTSHPSCSPQIVAIRADDPDAHRISDMASLEYAKPGITAMLVDWLKM